MTQAAHMTGDAPTTPAHAELAELKARVAQKEAELGDTFDSLVDAVRQAVDWRKVVAEHPLECALGAATLGFLVTYRPEMMGKSGESSVKMLMNFGAESLVQAAVSHFAAGQAHVG